MSKSSLEVAAPAVLRGLHAPCGPAPATGEIMQIKATTFPDLRFEWHPESKRVYVIRLGTTPEFAEPFAFEIENSGTAHNAVLIWLRGYRAGQAAALLPAAEQRERSPYVVHG